MWLQSLSLIVRTVSVDVNEATPKTCGYKDAALLIPFVDSTKAPVPSVISLMVSVDVKYHVYLLTTKAL